MKKLLALCLSLVCAVTLVACGGSDSKDSESEIVMITDVGTIDDKSFNQGTYEGVKKYAEDNDITFAYIKPTEQSDNEYMSAIDQAIEKGAKVVVCPGYLFEPAIFEKQTEYPDVKFVLIDGNPHDADYKTYKTEKNTIGITFQEEQSGFLAGYAAVKDGNTKLGFMGGMEVPAVQSFGYGYVQGAEYAAKEMNVEISMEYYYTGGFSATPEVKTMAASWYKNGTTIIFGCGGAVGNSCMSAAEDYKKENGEDVYVIGVDVDQSSESDTVISSAYKQLKVAVNDALTAIYNGDFEDKKSDTKFHGGENIVLGAADDAVGLPMKTSKWKTFSQDDYDAIFKKVANGDVEIKNYEFDGKANELGATKVTVNLHN